MSAGHRRPILRADSDDRLVARFRGGDEAAFGAQDVVQDVFLRGFRKLGANDRPMHLARWLGLRTAP